MNERKMQVGDVLPNGGIVIAIQPMGHVAEVGDGREVVVLCVLPRELSHDQYACWRADALMWESTCHGWYADNFRDASKMFLERAGLVPA